MSAFRTLKKARAAWPDIVDRDFLQRYLDEGLLTAKQLEEILKGGGRP